jgi:hypothetical protein
VDIGGPGPQPPPGLGIWPGPNPPYIDIGGPAPQPPPGGGGGTPPQTPKLEAKVGWTPMTGWVVVYVPTDEHATPSTTPPAASMDTQTATPASE